MEQTTNYLPHIIVGFVALLAGWAIGFFDSNLRSSKKIKQAEDSAQIALQDAREKIAQAEAQLASAATTPVTVDDPGLMRISNENGMLALDLDGVRVNTLAFSPEQRKRLIEMLNIMRPWLENKPAPMPDAPAVPPPAPVYPAANLPQNAPVNSAPPASQTVAPKPAPAPAQKKEEKTGTAPTSMVGQINAILQSRITNTKFADMGVTMIESPSGGVFVYVGLDKFEGIEAVPDEEIKSLIRAAIADWEQKYTPGI